MKLQQEILSYLSGKLPEDREGSFKKNRRYKYSLVDDSNHYKTVIRETEMEHLNTLREEPQSMDYPE